ncbi:MAG: aminoacyl-tRNA hydrolase [Planctomycetota bacterium]|nr:MAG: aminoacyl-tRNA hydrolase [Planctomycetota bacterium]
MDESQQSPKMVVGLGNPGPKYERTRHNVGFDVLNRLAQRLSAPAAQSKFEGLVTTARVDGDQRLVLVWPLTYMNQSGRCVQAAARFYKINVQSDLLVVCDDLSLPLGRLRMRARGSAGGQKGLADILRCLGTQEVPRLRIGIGAPPPRWDAADYVLSRFTADEQAEMAEAQSRACDAVLAWCKHGVSHAMNEYNKSP